MRMPSWTHPWLWRAWASTCPPPTCTPPAWRLCSCSPATGAHPPARCGWEYMRGCRFTCREQCGVRGVARSLGEGLPMLNPPFLDCCGGWSVCMHLQVSGRWQRVGRSDGVCCFHGVGPHAPIMLRYDWCRRWRLRHSCVLTFYLALCPLALERPGACAPARVTKAVCSSSPPGSPLLPCPPNNPPFPSHTPFNSTSVLCLMYPTGLGNPIPSVVLAPRHTPRP